MVGRGIDKTAGLAKRRDADGAVQREAHTSTHDLNPLRCRMNCKQESRPKKRLTNADGSYTKRRTVRYASQNFKKQASVGVLAES